MSIIIWVHADIDQRKTMTVNDENANFFIRRSGDLEYLPFWLKRALGPSGNLSLAGGTFSKTFLDCVYASLGWMMRITALLSLFLSRTFFLFFLFSNYTITMVYPGGQPPSIQSFSSYPPQQSLQYMDNVMSRFGHHMSADERTSFSQSMVPVLQSSAPAGSRDPQRMGATTAGLSMPSNNNAATTTTTTSNNTFTNATTTTTSTSAHTMVATTITNLGTNKEQQQRQQTAHMELDSDVQQHQ
ncbi:hypothetical protein BDB00DRAFT_507012 [Zychaea mexicana]|uniref:uncharacterized protein n=1 Tax=Zychaea mexicana TaxID=64656 RepID=UPI0022FEFA8D|nr:uncharacterized protein BDB00DRAFT_507012 [Zychaea mexicana]KAI9491253.1 hypothetical protein BDB00DRAFT_507012 [Zychaea mexicana]